jgi:hypothetical protein
MESMSFDNILGAIGGVCLMLFVAFDMPPATERTGDTITLRYARWVRIFYLFATFGVQLGITVLAIYLKPKDDEEMWCLFLSYMLFLILTTPMLWWVTRFSLTLSREGVEYRSHIWGRRFIAWDEVADLSPSQVVQWYILRTHSGSKIRIPSQLVPGMDLLFAAFCERAPCNLMPEPR